jgi:hypothetical protein
MRIFPVLCALAGIAATPVLAQRGATGDGPPERESTLVVYGDDACPQSTEDEIVVCARRPEEERYRIPPALRHTELEEVAWGTRAMDLDATNDIGRPNSCSVVGAYGQSGCSQRMIDNWYAERRGRGRR